MVCNNFPSPLFLYSMLLNIFSHFLGVRTFEEAFLETAKKIYQNIQDGRWVIIGNYISTVYVCLCVCVCVYIYICVCIYV